MPYFVCEECKACHCARRSPGPNIVVDRMCDFFIGWCDIEKYKPPECTEIVVKDSKGKMHLAFYQPGWDVGYAHKDPVVMDSNTGEKIEDPAKWLKGMQL